MHSSYQEFISHGHGKFGPWFDLVNSEEWDTFGRRTEHFHNPAWLPFFLRRWHFPQNRAKSFPLAKYQALRSALRAMCEAAAAGQVISPAALHTLNQAMKVRGKRQLCDGQNGFAVEFVPEHSNWAAILAETAHSFASLLSASELSRIKICRNPLCRWVFYDQSKAKSRCWCDDKICGNRERVRRARAKASH
jgi:predicted RNA-binding Zn ribbon-like protein